MEPREPRDAFERVILAMARVAIAEREAARARYRAAGVGGGEGERLQARYRAAIEIQHVCQDEAASANDALVRETGGLPTEPMG
jgi:ABC-type histidine transport system ATPase subunit